MIAKLTYADFDDDAVLTMQLANQSARKLNHDYIDTEHILLGLCLNLRLNASKSMTQFGVVVEQIVPKLKRRVRRGFNPVDRGKRLVRPNAKRVTDHATEVASSLNTRAIGNKHLLLGMLIVDGSIAFDVLNAIGLQYDDVIAYIKRT